MLLRRAAIYTVWQNFRTVKKCQIFDDYDYLGLFIWFLYEKSIYFWYRICIETLDHQHIKPITFLLVTSAPYDLKHGLRTPREEIVFTAFRKFNPNPKFLGTAEAYFVCHIGLIFHISFIYAFIWCPKSVISSIMLHIEQAYVKSTTLWTYSEPNIQVVRLVARRI